MTPLYITRVTASGGRTGSVRSDNGLLDLALSLPAELGGSGQATNPEQLFAAGYAACFGNAVIHIGRRRSERIRDADVVVSATVGLIPDSRGAFALSVALDVCIRGLDEEAAGAIVREAHAVCPYSNAIKGNVDVMLNVVQA